MRLISAVCLALILGQPAVAADVTSTSMGSGGGLSVVGTLIRVTGEFHAGDDRKLKRALLESDGTVVVEFESPGGSLIAGLGMGRALWLHGATTAVQDGAVCASACGLAWLGGERRLMGSGARVGFHAAYYVDDQGRKIETGQGNALIGAYLNQLGFSERSVLYITGAAPSGMSWLNPDEAEDLGISIRRIGATQAPPPQPTRPVAPPQPATATPTPTPPAPAVGTDPSGAGWQVVHHAPAGYMNVRAGPGTHHPVAFTVLPSQQVSVGGCRLADAGGGAGRWCLITASGRSGWISHIGLEPLGTTSIPDKLPGSWQIIHNGAAGFMNVRTGPGTNHPVQFTLPLSMPVAVMDCRLGDQVGGGIWCRILSGGQIGWISRSGLEPEGARAQSTATPATTSAPTGGTPGWRIRADISGGFANVRTGPGTMHGVVFTISVGAPLMRVTRCRPPDPGGGRFDWCEITWQGRSGWISINAIEQQG